MTCFHTEINKIFKPLRKMQLITIFFSLSRILFIFLLLLELQKTIDSISLQNLSLTQAYLKNCALLITIFFLINCIFQYLFRNLQYTSHYCLIKSLFGMSLEKDYSFHETYVPSALLSMIKDDSKFISDWKSIGVITVTGNFVTMAAVFFIMLHYNLTITVIIFCVIALCFCITLYISKIIGNKTYDLQVSNTEVSKRIIDYLNGFKDIKQFKKETFFRQRLADFIDHDTYKHSKSISQYYSVFTSVFAMLTTALPVLSILIGVILILNHQYTIGQLITTYALVENLQEPVLTIPEFFNQRKQALAIQNKLLPILQNASAEYPGDPQKALDTFTFHSNSYSFKDTKTILEHINFTIRKGEAVIIKGESGKGKTSLINLISRFYSAKDQDVHMEYNGTPVDSIALSDYYEHILQAQQMPYIFRDKVIDNITLGETFAKEELDEVIYTAGLEDFICTKGFDYLIEQNGENISGGQKQRLGLARVLLRKPDILMLDEPTSALNPELVNIITERVVQYCERHKISLIIISHNDSFERYYQRLQCSNVKILHI